MNSISDERSAENMDSFHGEDSEIPSSILEAFLKSTENSGSYPCIIFDDIHFSYRTIDQMSTQLAEFLRENGCTGGMDVAICLPMSPQFLISYLGVIKAGSTPVILGELRKNEFAQVANLIPLKWIIMRSDSRIEPPDGSKVITARIGDLLTFMKAMRNERGHAPRAKNIISTLTEIILDKVTYDHSGPEIKYSVTGFLSFSITGEPEILKFGDQVLMRKAGNCRKVLLNQGVKFRNVSVIPPSAPEGLIFSFIIPAMTEGYTVACFQNKSLKRVLRDADIYNANFLTIIPEMLGSGKEFHLKNRDRIRGIIINSFFSPSEMKKSFTASSRIKLIEYFGAPETCGITHISDPSSPEYLRPIISGETFLMGEEKEIISDPGKPGALWCRISEGSLNWKDDSIYLGYHAQYDTTGALIRITSDRDLGILRGRNVSGRFLEQSCGLPPHTREIAVVFTSDSGGLIYPVFYCVPDGHGKLEDKKVLTFLSENSSFLDGNGKIVWKKELPRSLSGKVLKNILLNEK
ncbi:MAG: acyl--CoA ligase [Candidatus Thermoplasmatota archaeon]|nr:acyl--CoA ligase [Candidatus Thermoplasmatota archaeon]